MRLRLLSAALSWVSGAPYRPRLVRLEAALAVVEGGGVGHGLTLHGCVLRARGGRVAIRRELARMAPAVPLAAGRWDGRWEIEGTPPAGERPDDRRAGRRGPARGWRRTAPEPAREALAASPAIWREGALVAAPVARPEPAFGFRRVAAVAPPWRAGDSALNPGRQALC